MGALVTLNRFGLLFAGIVFSVSLCASELLNKEDMLCEKSCDIIVFSLKNPTPFWLCLSLKCCFPKSKNYELIRCTVSPGEVAVFDLKESFVYILTVLSLNKERYFKIELESIENSDFRKFILRPIGMKGEVLKDKKVSIKKFKGNQITIE